MAETGFGQADEQVLKTGHVEGQHQALVAQGEQADGQERGQHGPDGVVERDVRPFGVEYGQAFAALEKAHAQRGDDSRENGGEHAVDAQRVQGKALVAEADQQKETYQGSNGSLGKKSLGMFVGLGVTEADQQGKVHRQQAESGVLKGQKQAGQQPPGESLQKMLPDRQGQRAQHQGERAEQHDGQHHDQAGFYGPDDDVTPASVA